MHPIQEAILKLADRRNLAKLSLRSIGLLATGREQAPQLVKYHLEKLVEAKLLRYDKPNGVSEPITSGKNSSGFVAIPILGAANCGPAKAFAEECFDGYLCLSKNFEHRNRDGLFAIRAIGNSMNQARIDGKKNIADGDYVIVDGKARSPKNGDYVLSVAGGLANIKKYVKDDENGYIALVSESTEAIPPIFVHPKDDPDFFVNGRVIDVLKIPMRGKQANVAASRSKN